MPAQHDTGRPAQRHRAPPRPSSTWRPDSGCATEVPLPCSAPAFSPSPTRQTAASGSRASRGLVVEPTPAAATVPPLAAEAALLPSTFYPPNRKLAGETGGRGGRFFALLTLQLPLQPSECIVRAPFRQNSGGRPSQQLIHQCGAADLNRHGPDARATCLGLRCHAGRDPGAYGAAAGRHRALR